ncbi:sulfite exporter TauE/SafE family protein [Halomonas campisalis]|uniref:Probable membrane transporter protein n=1 Tax=Billgrantia campisalis TaxID=74661 RepID=A0ABS9PAL1_9GAMM|nr:sulfite exporter TauE/SafE family protein [Halomonas campisalis]MCG6658802.1 sulfite exporter TauE/SafE family protein [Halomonas campisalis]MDR5864765.1 sulfite exporter TauE/SafE family protein [Halomonas campisalis]
MLELLSPLSGGVNLGLVALSALTSGISAAAGIGGGTLLIMTMAQVMPAAALIPVHGMVQLGSNGGRAVMTWRHVRRDIVAAFLPGVILGAVAAAWLLIRLPYGVLELCIAAFVLYSCWGPGLPQRAVGRTGTVIAGAVTTLLSSLVGASGPLVASFIKLGISERLPRVATFATCMTLQHTTKAFIFGFAGFVFRDWLGLMLAMVAAGFAGTWLGLRLLHRVTDHRFDFLFNWVLTLLALRLIWLGVERLMAIGA